MRFLRRAGVRPAVIVSVAAATAVGVMALAPSAQATTATIYVGGTSASDTNPCTSASAPCATVAGGITRAFSAFGSATDVVIDIAPGTYHEALAISEVPTGDSLSLVGTAGAASTTLDAGGKNAQALVYPTLLVGTGAPGSLAVTGLTVTGGTSPTSGGMAGYGAGIVAGANNGTVTVTNSVIEGNTATNGGGGIYSVGTLTVSGTTVSMNAGGGITALAGTTTVTDSTISHNTTPDGGAGIINQGTLSLTGSVISDNSVTGGGADAGGGIDNYGTATVTATTISGNSAGDGAGIEEATGALVVSTSTISGNTASGSGGGIGVGGSLSLTNSTISGNTAGDGGGIYNNGTATVTMSTVSGNSATTTNNGGGIENVGTSITVAGSILSADTSNGAANECAANPVTNGGDDVTSDNTCGFGSTNGSVVSTVAAIGLGALAANGSTGPQTEAIGATSSAHQVVPVASCTSTDERGMARPGYDSATHCDAGAYELQQVGTTQQTITFAGPSSPVSYGVAPISLSASATSGLPVTFTVTGPCSVAGSTLSVTGVGNCVITAHQAGNRTYVPAADVARTLVINKASTTTTVSAAPNPTGPDQAVTLTATVHYTGIGAAPTGIVTFSDNGTAIGTVSVSGGTATLTTLFGAGTNNVTASYVGDSHYLGSTSTPPTTVSVACDRTVTGSVSSLAVSSGTTCLVGATVTGGIAVGPGATLDVENSTVHGAVGADSAGLRICGSSIGGSVVVSGATGFVVVGGNPAERCAPNIVNGNIVATNDVAGTVIVGNKVTSSVTTHADTGTGPLGEPGLTVSGNHP